LYTRAALEPAARAHEPRSAAVAYTKRCRPLVPMALATHGCHHVGIWSWKDKCTVAALHAAGLVDFSLLSL